MTTYATAFIFYTLAMIGILLIAFVVYKKTFQDNKANSRGLIKILDSTPIGNKKVLLVVRVQDENFLIASGVEHTTFLSKLSSSITPLNKQETNYQNEFINQQQYGNYREPAVVNNQDLDNQQSIQQTIQRLTEQAKQMQAMQQNQQMQPIYNEPKASRAKAMQQQFRELYDDGSGNNPYNNQELQRKQMVKQLFKTMKTNSINRGNFNG